MSRSLVQRLKRLEIRCGPTREPREIVIEIVGPGERGGEDLYAERRSTRISQGLASMRSIARRLRRLEDRFGLAPETEADRLLAARLEAAHRRMAALGYKPHRPLPRFGVPPDRPITLVEILHAGRRRAALSRGESNSHEHSAESRQIGNAGGS
jgi:hypothetical protein